MPWAPEGRRTSNPQLAELFHSAAEIPHRQTGPRPGPHSRPTNPTDGCAPLTLGLARPACSGPEASLVARPSNRQTSSQSISWERQAIGRLRPRRLWHATCNQPYAATVFKAIAKSQRRPIAKQGSTALEDRLILRGFTVSNTRRIYEKPTVCSYRPGPAAGHCICLRSDRRGEGECSVQLHRKQNRASRRAIHDPA